ncbi:hypothetical protein ACWEP8_22830 [Streptomyces hydrogenans]
MFDLMFSQQKDMPSLLWEDPAAFFLLAGYDWTDNKFKIWKLHFDVQIDRFTFQPAAPWRGAGNDAVLRHLQGPKGVRPGAFDMEPMKALAYMVDADRFRSIGGHIQMVKIYKAMQCVPFIISRKETRSLLRRPMLDYEKSDASPTQVLDY